MKKTNQKQQNESRGKPRRDLFLYFVSKCALHQSISTAHIILHTENAEGNLVKGRVNNREDNEVNPMLSVIFMKLLLYVQDTKWSLSVVQFPRKYCSYSTTTYDCI